MTAKTPKPVAERIAECEAIAAVALAGANAARERNAPGAARRYDAKAQRWLDRANKLRGWD